MELIVETFKDVYNVREVNMKKVAEIAGMFKKNKFGCLSIVKKCFIQIMNSIYTLKMFPKQNLEIFEILLKRILKKLNNKQKNESEDQLPKGIKLNFIFINLKRRLRRVFKILLRRFHSESPKHTNF